MSQNLTIPVLPAMFLILFALKLAGPLAETSWWWITCPLWAPVLIATGLGLLAALLLGATAVGIAVVDYCRDRS